VGLLTIEMGSIILKMKDEHETHYEKQKLHK
jgi:hypothetical protein